MPKALLHDLYATSSPFISRWPSFPQGSSRPSALTRGAGKGPWHAGSPIVVTLQPLAVTKEVTPLARAEGGGIPKDGKDLLLRRRRPSVAEEEPPNPEVDSRQLGQDKVVVLW